MIHQDCHVALCTRCLKELFKHAEKDDTMEVKCPEPMCGQPLDEVCVLVCGLDPRGVYLDCCRVQHSMKTDARRVRDWVTTELKEQKYRAVYGDKYDNWDVEDIVTCFVCPALACPQHLRCIFCVLRSHRE